MNKFYQLSLSMFIVAGANSICQAQIPAGYYLEADGLSKTELKSALFGIISNAQMLGYGSGEGKTWAGFFQTDQLEDGSVFDRYSNTKRYFDGFNAVEEMNIEHSFPKSWWKGYENNAYRDLFHLYPSDAQTNMLKGNLPLGEVTATPSFDNGVSKIGPNGFGSTYNGSCFEPADEYKGDFARSYFYIVTAYENFESWWTSPMLENNRWPVFNKWSVDLLLKWHREDPVSSVEKVRQEEVYKIQRNRNPFIDYPELIEYIWGKDTLNTYFFPEETAAILSEPTRWKRVDMGIEMINSRVTKNLTFKGKNLNADILLSLKQNTGTFSISTNKLSATDVNEGTEIGITFEAINPGYSYDTLVISSPNLEDERLIPLVGLTALDFMTMNAGEVNATSAAFNWITIGDATNYLVDIYQGDLTAGDLIISKYIEGTSNNKAIELYNGTGKSVDLSRYSIKRQSNGNGAFSSELKLSGILQNGKTWLICNESAVDELKSTADTIVASDLGASAITFNGNDAMALYHDGIMIDLVGEIDNPADWGKDCSLFRLNKVTHPTTTFSWNEWTKKGVDTFAGINTHNMLFANTSNYIERDLSVGNSSSFVYSQLIPEQTYTYRVTAILSNNEKITTINTTQLTTRALEQPELLGASSISSTGFRASWEIVSEATHYLLDLFTLSGASEQYIEEGFNSVGSKGTPLPNGWSGTASGNYSTAASSGKSPNSISLKNTGEWLQSPDYKTGINKLSFMYRFPSYNSGAYFTIEGLDNNDWHNIDTIYCENANKYTPEYTMKQKFTAIRFNYANKVTGTNLALDDVGIWYGSADTSYVFKDQIVNGAEYSISGLMPETTYYYCVKAGVNEYRSIPSEIMSVTTLAPVNVSEIETIPLKYSATDTGIRLWNISEYCQIRLFDVNGLMLYKGDTSKENIEIPCSGKGLYIVQCIINDKNYTLRIIR